MNGQEPATQPLVAARGLTKRYPKVTALDDLHLELTAGIIGLVGANGAGKSTFIKLMLGLIEPTSGSVQVLGMDAIRQGHEVRQFVGYMPEHDCLPPDVSATEFVAHMAQVSGLPRSASRERTAEILRHVGLFEERYRQIGGYSTGMKQRVKLAQSLVHDPRLVLLDEPTNGLDPEGREEMLNLIQRIGTEFGMTIILSSHLLTEIERVCDHLVEIQDGRLIRSAAITELTRATRHLLIEVDGDIAPLAAYLRQRNIDCEVNERYLVVESDKGGAVLDAIRDGAVDEGLGLLRIEQGRHRLEELFAEAAATNEEASDG
jgi:ABC-2 type transport system ATP-binding protein